MDMPGPTIDVVLADGPVADDLTIEIVERKGIGHPDSLADGLAEATVKDLVRNHGGSPYIYADVVIFPGTAEAHFGGGVITKPFEASLLYISEVSISPDAFKTVSEEYLSRILRNFRTNYVTSKTRAVTPPERWTDLYVEPQTPVEDTAIAVGYAPMSRLENLVLEIETHLNGDSFKRRVPASGEDMKVLAYRRNDSVDLTLACSFVSAHVANRDEYRMAKQAVEAEVRRLSEHRFKDIKIAVNPDDEIENDRVYLTVSGSCIESSDWGMTGRGNRMSRVIAPFRPSVSESVAGKNVQNHPAKLFSLLSQKIANSICQELDVQEATVIFLGKIHGSIKAPDVYIRAVTRNRHIEDEIKQIVSRWLLQMDAVRAEYLSTDWRVF